MLLLEQRSIIGCSAQIAAAAGIVRDEKRARRTIKAKTASPRDRLDPRTCLRCGLKGPHKNAMECIEELRSQMGDLQLQIDQQEAPAFEGEYDPIDPRVRRLPGRPRKPRPPIEQAQQMHSEPITQPRKPTETELDFSRSLMTAGSGK